MRNIFCSWFLLRVDIKEMWFWVNGWKGTQRSWSCWIPLQFMRYANNTRYKSIQYNPHWITKLVVSACLLMKRCCDCRLRLWSRKQIRDCNGGYRLHNRNKDRLRWRITVPVSRRPLTYLIVRTGLLFQHAYFVYFWLVMQNSYL